MTYHAKLDAGGKVVLPEELLSELGVADGDTLFIEQDATGAFVIKTRAQVVREVREAFQAMRKPGVNYEGVVDELIRERRVEAQREDGEQDRIANSG